MTRLGRLCFFALLALATSAGLTPRALATGNMRVITDPAIVGPVWDRPGRWRTKIQQVFDPETRTLARRLYQVWDPEPARDLDFLWTPDRPAPDRPGRINGFGHLMWRIKGKPAFDRQGLYSEYRGTLRGGQISGRGAYLDHTGLLYDGEWRNGLMEGRGTLKLPSGDEYVGQFRHGKANGRGRYIDIAGEIYDGPFVDGHRHGRGTTTLPSGNKYASLWTEGKEAETSRLTRLAQTGGKGASGGADDIRIGITVDRRLRPPSKEAAPRVQRLDLIYAVSNTPNGFQIKPDNPRLMGLWTGAGNLQLTTAEEEEFGAGNEYGVLSLTRQQLLPLALILEVQNRSARQVQIAGAYLDVQKSVSNLKPVIQIKVGRFDNCNNVPDYKPVLKIENFGWGSAEQATLQLSFATPRGKKAAAPLAITKNLGRIEQTKQVDFAPDLIAARVDTAFLAARGQGPAGTGNGFACRSSSQQQCLEELRASGKFGDLAAYIQLDDTSVVIKAASALRYEWQDASGRRNTSQSSFTATLPLGHLQQTMECGEGGQRQAITSKPQNLRLDASNYRLPVSYKVSVSAGNTNRLTLPLKSDKSSEHDFALVLQLADGREIRSRPINLLYYLPSWFRRQRS